MHGRMSTFCTRSSRYLSISDRKCRGGHQAEVLYQHEGQLNPNAKRNAKKQQKKAKQAAASVASDGSGSDFDLDALPESDDELSE